jgi:glycosyltransferase involved in cell wall biosynthesis
METVEQASQTSSNAKLSILLPVRNEGINLRIMVKILEAVVEVPHEVLVVYDYPDDDSVPVVAALQSDYPNLHPVHNTLGSGVINAIRAGVNVAMGDYVLITACDDTGPVLAIEDMMALVDQGCDFVSGTRYAHGGRRLGGSLIGGFLSRLANRLLNLICGSVLTDTTTGLKMFRRAVFDQLHLEAKPVGWAVAFEMTMKAQIAGLKLGEVPIVSIDRLYGGESTFQLGPWFAEYLRWFWWGLIHLRRASGRKRPAVLVRVPSTTAE